MIEIFYVLLILLIIFILGQFTYKLISKDCEFNEEIIYSFAIGFGVIGYFVLVMGLFGLLYKYLFILFFLLVLILGYPRLKINLKKVRSQFNFKIKLDFVTILIYLFLFLNLVGALAPPTGWDTQIYHLTSQKIYISQHKITYIPLIHSDLPALGDMITLLGILLKSDVLSKLLFYFIFLVLVFSVYVFAKKYFDKKIAKLSTLIFVSLPLVIYYSSTVYTDMLLALFSLLSVLSFYEWVENKNKKSLFSSGIFLGLALSTKITAVITVIAFTILFFILLFYSKEKRVIFIYGLSFFIIVLGVSCLWFIKAFWFTQNPIYPIGYNYFGGPQNLSYTTEYTMKQLALGGYGKGIIPYFLSPLNITRNGYQFGSSFSLSVLYLSFLPLLIFLKKNKFVNYLLIFCFIYFTIWFIIHPFLIKMTPILPLLCILTSYTIFKADETGILPKISWLFLLFTIIFSLAMSGLIYKNQFKVAFGLESREEYLSKNLQIYDVYSYANKNLNKNNKILIIGESRYYYLDIPFQEGDPVRQGVIDYRNIEEGSFKNWIGEQNISHLLINREYFFNISDSEINLYGYTEYSKNLIENFTEKETNLIYQANNVYLYEIKKTNQTLV